MTTDRDRPRRRHRFESYLLGLGVAILAVLGVVNISDKAITTDN